jgi:hypothetical protein
MSYTQVETGYAQQEEVYIKPRASYMNNNKVAAQAKIGYALKTMGYTIGASTFRATLYQSARTRGATHGWKLHHVKISMQETIHHLTYIKE